MLVIAIALVLGLMFVDFQDLFAQRAVRRIR